MTIDELLQSMTLKEKIGQLNMTTTPRTEEDLKRQESAFEKEKLVQSFLQVVIQLEMTLWKE